MVLLYSAYILSNKDCTEMTAVTENDLKRLEDLIIGIANGQKAIENRLTAIENGQSKLTEKVENIDKRLAVVEAKLDEWKPSMAKITDLAEKVGELKNWKQIGLVIITAFISSILSGILGGVIGWLIRSAKFNP
jgi:chromosome segregation ATPase